MQLEKMMAVVQLQCQVNVSCNASSVSAPHLRVVGVAEDKGEDERGVRREDEVSTRVAALARDVNDEVLPPMAYPCAVR